MLIDTHAHLYLQQFDQDIDAVEARAREAGVMKIMLPNVDVDTIERMHALNRRDPHFYGMMMGLHPCSVHPDTVETTLETVEMHHRQKDPPYFAVGEIGLDYYWDTTHASLQQEAFRRQIALALEQDLPIVIHNRESTKDSLAIVEEMQNGHLRGVFHCFTGTEEEARRMIDLGFYIGIGGVATFKNSGLRATLARLPLERMVVETDAPYLAPAPYRGKRNESSYTAYVARCLADEVFHLPLEEIESVTTNNAKSLFNLPISTAMGR